MRLFNCEMFGREIKRSPIDLKLFIRPSFSDDDLMLSDMAVTYCGPNGPVAALLSQLHVAPPPISARDAPDGGLYTPTFEYHSDDLATIKESGETSEETYRFEKKTISRYFCKIC